MSEEKKVTIEIPFDERNPDDEGIFVSVNGETYQVKRGEPVEVPDYVAAVIKRSMNQKRANSDFIRRNASNSKK